MSGSVELHHRCCLPLYVFGAKFSAMTNDDLLFGVLEARLTC